MPRPRQARAASVRTACLEHRGHGVSKIPGAIARNIHDSNVPVVSGYLYWTFVHHCSRCSEAPDHQSRTQVPTARAHADGEPELGKAVRSGRIRLSTRWNIHRSAIECLRLVERSCRDFTCPAPVRPTSGVALDRCQSLGAALSSARPHDVDAQDGTFAERRGGFSNASPFLFLLDVFVMGARGPMLNGSAPRLRFRNLQRVADHK
jgi:hypothetical protein